MELNALTVKKKPTVRSSRYRPTAKARRPMAALGTKPTREQIFESPLLFDEKRFWRWACKRYEKTFMKWVRHSWTTASEREVQVMHRAWIAAGGAAD